VLSSKHYSGTEIRDNEIGRVFRWTEALKNAHKMSENLGDTGMDGRIMLNKHGAQQ
jgi:hypothetical protein